MPRERNRYRDRRSSSHSSETSYERKKSKSKYKRRSRSRDRSESNKRKRSDSRSKYKRRSYSRSLSRDRREAKSRRRSRSRSKRAKHSISKDRSRSRSSSYSRSKHRTNKKSGKKSRSSSSRSGSFDIEPAMPVKKMNLDDTEIKLEKAIRAAEAAGLTMTKLPSYEYKDVEVKKDMPTIHDRNLLDELNCDSFVQRTFTSSRSKKQSQNIVIDLNNDTVKVPESDVKEQKDDCIIDFDAIPCEEDLKEMWIKKLYQYRKKMLRGEL